MAVRVNGRPWAAIAATGETVSLFGGITIKSSRKRMTELADHMLNEWRRLAHEMVPEKYREDYFASMSASVTRDGIELTLGDMGFARTSPNDGQPSGLNALRVELGWRPPDGRGRHFNEGLGEYDGMAHDMRSFMLTSDAGSAGRATVKTSEKGEQYRVIAFDEAKTFNQIVDEMTEKYGEDAAKTFAHGLQSLPASGGRSSRGWRGTKSLNRKWTDELQAENKWTVGAPVGRRKPTYREHFHPKYHQVVKNYTAKTKTGRARFTVYRSIVDSDRQKQRYLWFTVGTRPVRVLEELEPVLRQALKETLLSKK